MFSVYFLFALIFSTVGTPFPASSHEFDDPGSISPNNAGLDVFGSDTLPNADTIPTFSLASSPDDSLFAGEPPGYSGWESLDDPTMSANLPSNLAISGVGADDNIFGITTIDDGLPGELFNVDGSDKSFDLATKPSTGAANSCVSEVIQSIGKRKRVACQNPETGINTDTDTQTESQVENKEQRPLDEETLRHISGLDQPGLLQRELCLESFEAVCCTGQDNLGLVQTGCSKYAVNDWGNMDCYDINNILCCMSYDPDAHRASSCYSPRREPAVYPLKKVPDPLNVFNDPLGSLLQPPN